MDVYCIKQKGQKEVEMQNGVTYFRLPILYNTKDTKLIIGLKYLIFTAFTFIKVLFSIKNKKYNIIHVHNPPDFIILAALPFKLFSGSKIVMDLHDMLPEAIISNFNVDEEHSYVKIARIIEKIFIQSADALICTNESDKEIILSRNKFPSEKIFIVMNSPDLEILELFPNSKKNTIFEDKYIILFQGSIWKRRGIQTVIEALKDLKEQIPIHCIILGDGPDLEYLKRYAEENKIMEQITFTGWVDLKELSKYTALSDLCLIPFLDTAVNRRGVPNKLFEYIVHNKPVLSSQLKGIASSFSDQEITFFKPGDAHDLAQKIKWCYKNPEIIKNKTIAAKKRYYSEYTWEKMEQELYRCYERLLGGEKTENWDYPWNQARNYKNEPHYQGIRKKKR